MSDRDSKSGAGQRDAKTSDVNDVIDLARFRQSSGSTLTDHAQRAKEQAENEAIEWIARLRSDADNLSLQGEFALWLSASPENENAFDAMTEIWSLAGPAITQYQQTTKVKPKRRMQPFAALATAATFVLTAFLFLVNFSAPTIATERGEQRRVVLEDGSTAYLNTHSEITMDFDDSQRLVTLTRGEVWFDVRHDASAPFIVATQDSTATAVGTAFAVSFLDASSTVTVTEGLVDVRGQYMVETLQLSAGERINLNPGMTPASMTDTVPEDLLLTWRSGQLVYENEKLEDVLADLSRYVPKNMVLSDDAYAELRVSAVLQLSDQSTMLDALARAFDVTWKHVSDELVLIIPK